MKKIATAQDVLDYPELALVEGQEFEVPEALTLNEGNEQNSQTDSGDGEGDPPPGSNNPDKKPIIP